MKSEHISDISEFETISSRPMKEISAWWNEKTFQEQQKCAYSIMVKSENEKLIRKMAKLFWYQPYNNDKTTNGVLFAQKILDNNPIEEGNENKNATL